MSSNRQQYKELKRYRNNYISIIIRVIIVIIMIIMIIVIINIYIYVLKDYQSPTRPRLGRE